MLIKINNSIQVNEIANIYKCYFSQGTVEIYNRGEKDLHCITTNLFSITCAKFYNK